MTCNTVSLAGDSDRVIDDDEPPQSLADEREPCHDDALDLRNRIGRTDLASAARFAQMHGRTVRWCEPWGRWLAWDGRRWSIDAEKRIDVKAKATARGIWTDAIEVLPGADAANVRELLSFARTAASATGIRNMLALAQSESGIPIQPGLLDANPWSLNCSNGILDLRTGKLRPHDPAALITKICPVAYDEAATCPRFEAMLSRIVDGNQALIDFLRRAAGYSLTGMVSEQCLFLLWGAGANGKSTFVNAVRAAIGDDYGTETPSELLLATRSDQHPTAIATLHGRRIASCSEVQEERRFSEANVKRLTGGERIAARRMREDFWEFDPTHKFWISCNHLPNIKGTDHGIWRRVKLIPFNVTIPDDEQDPELPQKLRDELPGILAWCVRGCLEWQREGLGEPAEVTQATAGYRADSDVIGAFLSDCCHVAPGAEEKAATLFDCYKKWCETTREHALNQRRFGTCMTERGFERFKRSDVYYRGVELSRDERDDQG